MVPQFENLSADDQRRTLAFFFAFDSMYNAESLGDTEAAHFWVGICDRISARYPHVIDDSEAVCAVLASRLSRKAR